MTRTARVRPRQVLVDPEAGEEVGDDRRPGQLLTGRHAVVEKAGLGRVDGLARAAPLRVVLETRGTSAADGLEAVARIPRVRVGPIASEITVQVVGQRRAAEGQLVVGRVIGSAGEGCR